MKKWVQALIVIVFVVLCAGSVLADPATQQIPFTRETTLDVPADYTFRFSLWDVVSGGAETPNRVWWEEKTLSLADPTINTFLGSVTDPAQRSGYLGDVDFSQQYWVQVEKREANDTYTVLGSRTMFTMPPYAMWSAQGGNVTSVIAGNGLTGTGTKGDVALSVNTGAGLTTAADGSLEIASNGVANSMIVNSAVTKSKIGGLSYGAITYGSAMGNLEQNNNLFWDLANYRLGLGIITPQEQLHLSGNLRLPTTTGAAGQIKIGSTPFIHAYGTDNTFIGLSAGNTSMTGSYNSAIGAGALALNTTGYSNTAGGASALIYNTTGYGNTATGAFSLRGNTTGNNNVANGAEALYGNTTGYNNTAMGRYSLNINTTGYGNTASGSHSLLNNSSGSANTGLGWYAGDSNTTGSNNTFVGYLADAASGALTNATAIGSSAIVGQSNSLVLGSTGVNVGIGTSTPTVALDVNRNSSWLIGRFKNSATTGDRTAMVRFENGDTTPVMWNIGAGGAGNGIGQTSGQFYLESASYGVAMSVEKNKNIHFYPSGGGSCNLSNGASGWSCSSDRDLKENFTEIDKQQILDHLSAMPVTMWNMKGTTVKHIGPVAQDFYAAFNVGEDDRHINTVDEGGVSLAAIQALYDIVKKQQQEIEELKAMIKAGR
jgi:hypothetical protein